jgi:hypothetical protein
VSEQVVAWNTEPAEYEFRFVTSAGRTRLEVYLFPDAGRLGRGVEAPTAVVEGEAPAIVRAVWRALRRLQGSMPSDEFAGAWGHPFPATTVERLGKCLRAGVGHGPSGPG